MTIPEIITNNNWALWTILMGVAALGLWSERTGIGSRLSGAAVTMLLAFALSNLNIIPHDSEVYRTVWTYMVPLAIPLLLFDAEPRRILIETGPTLLAFAIGIVGTLLGILLGYLILPLGEHGWQMVAVLTANFIGGATNYDAVAAAVGLHDSALLEAGMAVDHLLLVFYLLLLFSLPTLYRLRIRYHERPERHRLATEMILRKESRTGDRINLPGLSTALTLSLLLCTLGYLAEGQLGYPGTAIVVIVLLGVVVTSVFRVFMPRLEGALEAGNLLMHIFFATLGASANIQQAFQTGPTLLTLAAITLLVHLAFMLIVGRYARLSLPEILIASNANAGGPGTAVAMAAARRWHALMAPAVLCGIFGQGIGSFIGIGLGRLLH